jgi:isocitrate lyase
MSKAAAFRRLIASEPYVHTTGIYTPLQAKIAQSVGLKAGLVSGYSCSLAYLGRADLGFATMTEMAGWARAMATAVDLPLIADGDDGHGNALHVMRTVGEFERAGVAGLTLEDQQFPKRCGHLDGRVCLPAKEAAMKLKAALDARSDPDFFIIARTDAVSANGGSFEEVVERGKRYADVGVDMVWPEFPTPDRGMVERFAQEMSRSFPSLPLFFNYSSSFDWTRVENPLTFQELAQLGYRFIVVGLGAIHAAMLAEWSFMTDLVVNQEQAQIRLQRSLEGHPTKNHHEMGRLSELLELGRRYSGT